MTIFLTFQNANKLTYQQIYRYLFMALGVTFFLLSVMILPKQITKDSEMPYEKNSIVYQNVNHSDCEKKEIVIGRLLILQENCH